MIANLLMAGGAVCLASEYYRFRQLVDVYPEKIRDVVDQIKQSIDIETYEYLTSQEYDDKPKKPAIEKIRGGYTKVVKFKGCSDYVVKTSKVGLFFDIIEKARELGRFYDYFLTSNSEGSVTRDIFRYAKRVIVAKKLRKIIKEHHLDKLKVPKKYLCSFPDHLVSKLSTPFYNRHVFILCERCDVDYVGDKTLDELRKMPQSDVEILSNQINILFLKSGVLDFLPHNFYIKNGQLVLFDTEPMSLAPHHLLCVSPTLRAARINFKNVERCFYKVPEAKPLVDMARRSMDQIGQLEREKYERALTITVLFLSVTASLLVFLRWQEGCDESTLGLKHPY